MRRRYSEQDRAEFIAEWERDGGSVSAMAKRWGIARKTAGAWIRESTSAREAETSRGVRFAKLVPAPSIEAPLVVQIGSVRIEVNSDTDLGLLGQVAGVLSEGLTS